MWFWLLFGCCGGEETEGFFSDEEELASIWDRITFLESLWMSLVLFISIGLVFVRKVTMKEV